MIEIKNLTKKYGKHVLFEKTNFTFPNTGLICIIGISGCGKSTLLNMLAGFDSDYSGTITVLDKEINKLNSEHLCTYRRNNIGFIFQNYNLLAGYTVIENIQLISNNTIRYDLLEQLGIASKANEKVENLSGGQKQRTAIIRALMNNPPIILADEPTGALDRKNATEIITVLKELAENRLVIVVTHDKKICTFADEVITIENGQLIGTSYTSSFAKQQEHNQNKPFKAFPFRRGFKNFKVHLKRYLAVALAISIGVMTFICSLSSGNMIEKAILDFKNKNTAFNNGYIKMEDNSERAFELLKKDNRVNDVYKQYVIHDIALVIGDRTTTIVDKYPMPKATETMSYGTMPEKDKKQIALSPSLAKKFNSKINKLIGNEVILKFQDHEYSLTISGIFNASYDDFFVSADIEKEFYAKMADKESYSLSYDVKKFEDIVSVTQTLLENNIDSKTAVKEVDLLQDTFQKISRLFLIISILILLIGLFISVVLLMKLQSSRYKELGLLSALGLHKRQIRAMILSENLLLTLTAIALNVVSIGLAYFISKNFQLMIIISVPQMIVSLFGTGVTVIIVSIITSHKLIHKDPIIALRK